MSLPPRYRALRVCSSGGGFEAIPEGSGPIDLGEVRRRLEAQGVAVTDARVMLIASTRPEVTISRSGRILVKTTDGDEARKAFDRILRLARPQLADSPPRKSRTP